MGIEITRDDIVLAPAGFDPHIHPRALDALVLSPDGQHIDGKAGIYEYTLTMLRSGYAGGNAMPNESIRTGRVDGGFDAQGYASETFPHPISTAQRVYEMEQRIGTESVTDMAILFGLDPDELYRGADNTLDRERMRQHFIDCRGRVAGVKIYGEETEGGYAIRVNDIPDAIEDWQDYHAGEPAVLHLEGTNVGKVLQEVRRRKDGKNWAIHIAHVSSRIELEAIIEAKQLGMNVTCEVTPHHLFLTEDDKELLGGQGCMKPSLKSRDDVEFLWANLHWIDMFGSDCAPHRPGDKSTEKPSFGVTNHPLSVPLILTEALKPNGRITLEKAYDMLCVQPRKRFNFPEDDGSVAIFWKVGERMPDHVEAQINSHYHESPFKTFADLRPQEALGRFGLKAIFYAIELADGTDVVMPRSKDTYNSTLRRGFHHILRPQTQVRSS